MSLFSKIRKSLGFPDEYEDLDDLADLEDADDLEIPVRTESKPASRSHVEEPITSGSMKAITQSMADNIVAVAKFCDTPDQFREEVMRVFNSNLPQLANDVRNQSEKAWIKERASLVKELSDHKVARGEFDSQKQMYEHSKLSNDRQRRAMHDRVTDMQRQIAQLEAEREQLTLENQCMANKLRGVVSPVINMTDETSKNDIRRLTTENNTLRRELTSLRRENMALKSTAQQPATEDAAEVKKREEERLQFVIDIENLKKKVRDLSRDRESLTDENRELGHRIAVDNEKINSLEQKVAELHKTIETNLTDHAHDEENMRKEIKRLNELIAAAEIKPAKEKAPRTRKVAAPKATETDAEATQKISAIDELMDNTDWFIAPQPGPRQKDPEVTENFGYKESSKKKQHKVDDNQLTLF